MKLRFLLVSALALAFMVPAALANDSTDGAGSEEETTKVEETKKSDQAAKAKKAKKAKRAKLHKMNRLCRPRVGVVVRGDFVAFSESDGTMTVDVHRANRHGKRFVDATATFKIAKWSKVRKLGVRKLEVRKFGKASFGDLKKGDRVKVMGRACKLELRNEEATPQLFVRHVKAKPAVEPKEESESKSETEKEAEESADKPTDESASDAA